MAKVDFAKLPRFSELPVKQGAPPDSSWGVFGDDDDLGCVNFLTPEGVVEAARLVKKGFASTRRSIMRVRRCLNANQPAHQKSFESPTACSVMTTCSTTTTPRKAASGTASATSAICPPSLLQRHHQRRNEAHQPTGIHNWAEQVRRPGLWSTFSSIRAGRGTAGRIRCATQMLPPRRTSRTRSRRRGSHAQARRDSAVAHRMDAGVLKATADAEDARWRPIKALKVVRHRGHRQMVAWLWDNRVAAIGTDCPSVESWPWDFRDVGALHYRTLPLVGLPLGEQFVLDRRWRRIVREDRRFTSSWWYPPLHLEGGIASPPNAVAIK